MDTTDQFISSFCQWAIKAHLPASSRRKFPKSLRRAIDEKLLHDDRGIEVISRGLTHSEKLVCRFDSPELWLQKNSKKEELVAGTIAPSWRRGWSEYEKDEFLEGVISDFFHFACQYVQRSRIVGLIGAIATTYERACDFRHGGLHISYAEVDNDPAEARKYHLVANGFQDVKFEFRGAKKREFISWVKSINSLDPYIHKAIFQFWRATSLFEFDYLEEAVTALDGVTAVALLYLQERMKVSNPAREDLQVKLGLSKENGKNLKTLYELRCDFGAHPSKSKWWDFGEIYDDDLQELRDSSKQLLWLLCKSEQGNRVIEPYPSKWSEWFRENALLIYDSVWFKFIR